MITRRMQIEERNERAKLLDTSTSDKRSSIAGSSETTYELRHLRPSNQTDDRMTLTVAGTDAEQPELKVGDVVVVSISKEGE